MCVQVCTSACVRVHECVYLDVCVCVCKALFFCICGVPVPGAHSQCGVQQLCGEPNAGIHNVKPWGKVRVREVVVMVRVHLQEIKVSRCNVQK